MTEFKLCLNVRHIEESESRNEAMKSLAEKLFQAGEVKGEVCEKQDVPILLAENAGNPAVEIGEDILRLSPLFNEEISDKERNRMILDVAYRAFTSVEEGMEDVYSDDLDELINENLGLKI